MSTKILLLLLLSAQLIFARWGWDSHRFINAAAVDQLPQSMNFFQDHRDYLSQHSTDPDTDSDPGYYHYIDIDYYPEFFSGDLPHQWQDMIDLYGQDIMEDNGIVPWVIEWWMADLQELMEAGEWTQVWQVAAELGHYVGDSHQALHLTLNYNGGLSGNYGIHSRYETSMINPHLDEIILRDSTAGYWESPIDSIFSYIADIYPVVDLVMAADDRAYVVDPNHGSTYYSMLWEDLGDTTIWSLNRAVVDLASIWYTSWLNAGSPYPEGVGIHIDPELPDQLQLTAYPNPFNPHTAIAIQLEEAGDLTLRIMDVQGRLITTLESGYFSAGSHRFQWDGLDRNQKAVNSGVYLVQVTGQNSVGIIKLTLLK